MSAGQAEAPIPQNEQLVELEHLYQAGRYLDAYLLCRTMAPLEAWQGTRALLLAGRLSSQWGNEPLSHRLCQRAYRADPNDPSAVYYKAQTLWGKHGVFAALLFLRRQINHLPQHPETLAQSHVWLLYARLLGIYRDYTAAEPIIERVVRAFPNDPWVWVDKADYLESQDLYTEALGAATEATRIQPWYRPAIQTQAHLLQLLERDNEAISLLQSAKDQIQSSRVVQMLVVMLEENGRLEEIPSLVDQVEALLPMPDAADRRWLAARRCMVAHRQGNTQDALKWARANGSEYYRQIAERLERSVGPSKRVHLSVGFIRQHYMTCAPATLTALSQYWERPADHQQIANAICYDGSPDHLEREWAEQHGWLVREFRPTWETACLLLDRGCPFAVATVETDSAHMQAVIGYDPQLGTLLIRDPYYRQFREWLADNFFAAYAAHGPRAMLMIPPERADLLQGLDLPDAELHDHYYGLRRALHGHDRDQADAALEQLRKSAPDHLLTRWGAYELAHYDGRLGDALEQVRHIRELHPADGNWRLSELRLRESLGDQISYRKFLHEFGATRGALVPIRREYAEYLARDASRQGRAGLIIRSILRRESAEPKNLRAYANLLWNLRELPDSTLIYRLAACRADKVEYHWDSYFIACRHMGTTEEALLLLQARYARLGRQSSLPARTLFDSLNALDRTDEGFRVLEDALRLRPDDGELLLFYANALCRYGRHAESTRLLEAARTRGSRPQWLRTAAKLADYQSEHHTALKHWRELASLNPADSNAQSAVARLLAITEGEAAAVDHLRQACAALPNQLPLRQLLVERLREAPPEQALGAVDQMLSLDPGDAWALREKALILRRLQHLEEALEIALRAMAIAPYSPSSHGVLADVLIDLGRREEAHASIRKGIQLSIDADWLYSRLLDTCSDFQARREAVVFLHGELMSQHSLDSACLRFRTTARSIVDANTLGQMLRAYHSTQPEVWAAWSSLCTHLLETGALVEAEKLARETTERFPLVPKAWIDLASVHAKAGDTAAEIEAIKKALTINPAWTQASRQLATAYEHLLQLDNAEHALRRAVASEPTEAANHALLGDVLWRLRRPEEALACAETAISFHPEYDWAWDRLTEWSQELGDKARARNLAKRLTETRAGEAGSWLRLARLVYHDPNIAETLRLLDRAAELSPRDSDVWDLRATLLAERLDYEGALAACRPAAFGDEIPHFLTGRAAWIEHRRGHADQAIKEMRALLGKHPDYAWGWARLTEWYWEKNEYEAMREPAEKWAWLNPKAAEPHGYLAILHQKSGRKKEAKACLADSLKIDPQYGFGVGELLGLHLEDGEFPEARQILKHYSIHFPPWEHLRAEVRFYVASKDRSSAQETLARLGGMPEAAAGALKQAVTRLLDVGWGEVADDALRPLLTSPATGTMVADQWMRARRARELQWTTLFYFFQKRHPLPMRRALLSAYTAWLGEKNRKIALLLTCLLWHRILRSDTEVWGQTGYALSSANLNRTTVYWLRDWSLRFHEISPWMVNNLSLSLLNLGRFDEARVVMDRSLNLTADHATEKIMCLRACLHALAGEEQPALRLLNCINASGSGRYYNTVLLLTRQLLAVQQAEPPQRKAVAKSAIETLRTELIEYPTLTKDQCLNRLYRRTLDRIGRDGSLPWQRVRSRLPMISPGVSSGSGVNLGLQHGLLWYLLFFGLTALLRSCG